jgi:GDP-D-mannose 3', 5'-epimerase
VCGADGFIGSHLVKRLGTEGFFVRGVDIKRPDFSETAADEFVIGDLRDNLNSDALQSDGAIQHRLG